MAKNRLPRPEDKREVIKLALEGGALIVLGSLAYKLVAKDSRLRNHGIEAGDIVNSTVVKVLSRADQFRGDAKPSTWFHRIAVNEAFDEAEKIHAEKLSGQDSEFILLETPDPAPSPEKLAQNNDLREKIMQALSETSSEIEQKVVQMHYFDDMSYEQIAEELNIPVNTAKSHSKKARDKMREVLEPPEAA